MKYVRLNSYLVWLLITVHAVAMYGCSSTSRFTLPGNVIPVGSSIKITTVILRSGETIEFDSDGGSYEEKTKDGKLFRAIVGSSHGKVVEIDSEKVSQIKFEQEASSWKYTFFAGILVGAGGLYLFAIAAFGGR